MPKIYKVRYRRYCFKEALGLDAPKELEKAQRLTALTEDLMIKIDTLDALQTFLTLTYTQWDVL